MPMERVLVQLPKELLDYLDTNRGSVPRAAFIRALIEKWFLQEERNREWTEAHK